MSTRTKSAFQNVMRNEPLVSGPPSPPRLDIPIPSREYSHVTQLQLRPSGCVVTKAKSAQSLSVVTQGRIQAATDNQLAWAWSKRHCAQRILDFLWLGPYSVVRDRDFIAREKFTMVFMVRDKKLADSGYMDVKNLSEKLGTAVDSVDVSSQAPLSSIFDSAVEKINSHCLDRHANQCEYVVVDGKRYPGKVLVCCETGNDRSAVVVAAYLMKVYEATFIEATQFVLFARFCAMFTDDKRSMLKAYEDSLAAQRQVFRERASYGGARLAGGIKRGFADTIDGRDTAMAYNPGYGHLDYDRFVGRVTRPFTDYTGAGGMDDSMQQDG
ncbi:hypothetical protein DL546_009437 [Coniochaeta pulveracea]|uniref:Tyrosine-protein phosphatase domain-containing protein n=1 Tax=Coniochaeta pulveracea TaxID=177199 RepID=A0A420YM84_9PEZI|nr:hypothetical protein DL546_009437 [Coniochaeta pulveracea]